MVELALIPAFVEHLPNTEDFREWIFLLALVDFYVSRIILP